jgi:hypothetical protein
LDELIIEKMDYEEKKKEYEKLIKSIQEDVSDTKTSNYIINNLEKILRNINEDIKKELNKTNQKETDENMIRLSLTLLCYLSYHEKISLLFNGSFLFKL